MMASALVHLGIDQTQHVQQPSTLITISQCQRRHAANTNYWYCWTSAHLEKQTGTDSIYSGPDVVQNQYQDLF